MQSRKTLAFRVSALSAHAQGKHAEQLAAAHLKKQGYKVLTCNFRSRFGEIDLVCLDKNTLVFVEVRQRRSSSAAAASIDKHKMRRLIKTANYYLYKNEVSAPCRFDVVCIGPLTDHPHIACWHIINAFNLSDVNYS
jgi:putative endonuclease